MTTRNSETHDRFYDSYHLNSTRQISSCIIAILLWSNSHVCLFFIPGDKHYHSCCRMWSWTCMWYSSVSGLENTLSFDPLFNSGPNPSWSLLFFPPMINTLCILLQTFGGKNLLRVGVILQRGTIILMLFCIPCWGLLINAEPILLLMGQDPTVAR